MKLEYALYSRNSLKQPPKQITIGGFRIDYLAFSDPANSHKVPLMVVGGAFQNFHSYRSSVEHFLPDYPVLLVDLPSLGNNDQLAHDLGFEDLPNLMQAFLDEIEVPQVTPIGLSLGSAIASTFAYKYPRSVDKLILMGIVARPRKSWRMLIEESLRAVEYGQVSEFSHAVTMYLINHNRLDETGISLTWRKMFQRQLNRATDAEVERYKINANRLLDVEKVVGYPSCKTLVATGEFDSFTMPFEHAEFVQHCPQATFVMIDGADHLPQFERKEVSLDLFKRFIDGESLAEIDGVRVIPRTDFDKIERRGEPRYIPINAHAKLCRRSGIGEEFSDVKDVRLKNLSFYGCLVEFDKPMSATAKHLLDLELHLTEPNVVLPMFAFEQNEQQMRCMIKHFNPKAAQQLKKFLEDPSYFRLPPEIPVNDDALPMNF